MFSTRKRPMGALRMAGAVLTVAAVGTAWSVAGAQNMNAQQSDSQQGSGARQTRGVSIGTYQPRQVLRSYHRTQALQQEMRKLQQQAQGDPQKAMQMRQQLQQKQQKLFQQFQQDLDKAVPEVAKEKGVKLVAAEIVYTAPDMETNVQDLTQPITAKINEGAENQTQTNQLMPGGMEQSGQQDSANPRNQRQSGSDANSRNGMGEQNPSPSGQRQRSRQNQPQR